jgi:protein tyrosine/serine phosphatase
MTGVYTYMPYRPYLIGIYRDYFAALAERPGASLLHCFAGKDRTGLGAALLHVLMGVHPDDVMADYLLTNVAGNIERRIAAGAKVVRGGFGRKMDDSAVRTIMSVDAAYLNAAFAAIRESHGSIEHYCDTVLGVTPQTRAKLQAQLLV